MNSWRWLGLSIFLFATVCLLGTTKFSAEALAGDADKKFEVSATPDKATVEPGKSASADIKAKRGKDVKKDITLTAEVSPKDKGVTAKVDPKVDAKDSAKLTVDAAAAADGDYKVTVNAKSEGSPDASVVFALTVKKAVVVEKKPETPPVAGAWAFKAFSTKDVKIYTKQVTKTKQDMKVMGQSVVQNQEQTFIVEWTPLEGTADNYIVKQRIHGVFMEINIGGNKISYDSRNPTKQKNPMTDFFEQLTKKELEFTISKKDLEVKSIKGRDEFIKGLSDINPQMQGLLKAILSEKSLTKMAEPTWYAFPKDGVVPADKKWQRKSDLDLGPIGSYKTTFNFALDKTEGGKELIGIKTDLEYTAPTDKVGLPFIIHKATLTGKEGTGTTVFDIAKGRFDKTSLTMKLAGTLEIEVGSMKTTVELTQDQTSTSETLDALPDDWKTKAP